MYSRKRVDTHCPVENDESSALALTMSPLTTINDGGSVAACISCGDKAGVGRRECRACQASREAKQRAESAERARQVQDQARQAQEAQARELAVRTQTFIDGCLEQMEQAHAMGLVPSLIQYRSVSTTFSIQSEVRGEPPNFAAYLSDLSLGWEIVGIVPHTEGVALFNRTGNGNSIYAGGFGGIVSGAYVILRLNVTPEFLSQGRAYIEAVLRAQYEDGTSAIAPGGLLNLAPGATVETGMSRAGQVVLGAAAGMAAGAMISDLASLGDVGGVDSDFDGGDGGDFGGFDF